MKQSRSTALLGILLSVAFCGALGGCSTAVRSHPVGVEAEPGREYGIIYQMTRPEIRIMRTPPTADAPAKYTLLVAHVPDPDHRYGLSIAPGCCSTVDQAVTLGGEGSIVALTSTSKEQVTPTIKAIGDFVVNLVGAAASVAKVAAFAAHDPNTIAFGRYVEELATRIEEGSDAQGKQDAATLKETIRKARPAGTASPDGYAAALLSDIEKHAKDRKQRDPTAPDPEKEAQRLWGLVREAASPPSVGPERRRKAVEDYEAQKSKGQEVDSPAPPEFRETLSNDWAWVRAEVAAATTSGDLARLIELSTVEEVSADRIAASKVPADFIVELKDRAKELAESAQEVILARADLSEFVSTPTPAQRRRNRAGELLQEIEGLRAEWGESAPADRPAIEGKIASRREELHSLLDASVEYQAILKLEALLRAGPPAAGDVAESSPLKELSEARSQWLALQADVVAKYAKLAKDAEVKPPPRKDLWGPENVETAFVWNVQRAPRDLVTLPRLLKLRGEDAEIVARVRRSRGDDPRNWPKFAVKIDKEQP